MDKRTMTNIEWLHMKYYIITYQSKILIYYVIKKLKNRIFDIDILSFLALYIEIL